MTIPFAVPLLVLAPSGILSDRLGTLPLEMGGMVLIALATSMLAFAGSSLTLPLVILSLVVMGLGFGIFFTPNYSAVMGSVPTARLGVAGGIYGTMRTMGILTGVAMATSVMGVWATVSPALEGTEGYLNNAAFEAALRNAYLAGFLVALVCLSIFFVKGFYVSSGREAIGRRV
jgi:MFS family permease